MPALPSRFGPYEIIGPVGAGGMGQVFRARDTRLQRTVAVKILHEAGALDPVRQQRFAREAIAASALNHPNIVSVYDVGVEGETPYLVSELIEGTSLRNEMVRGRLPLKRTLEIVQQIADGLAAAHEAGIVHRDLKPENIMWCDDGGVKVLDLGIARIDSRAAFESIAPLTADGLIVGTPAYMSPELWHALGTLHKGAGLLLRGRRDEALPLLLDGRTSGITSAARRWRRSSLAWSNLGERVVDSCQRPLGICALVLLLPSSFLVTSVSMPIARYLSNHRDADGVYGAVPDQRGDDAAASAATAVRTLVMKASPKRC
jgi:serine/threonine protein kinase